MLRLRLGGEDCIRAWLSSWHKQPWAVGTTLRRSGVKALELPTHASAKISCSNVLSSHQQPSHLHNPHLLTHHPLWCLLTSHDHDHQPDLHFNGTGSQAREVTALRFSQAPLMYRFRPSRTCSTSYRRPKPQHKQGQVIRESSSLF